MEKKTISGQALYRPRQVQSMKNQFGRSRGPMEGAKGTTYHSSTSHKSVWNKGYQPRSPPDHLEGVGEIE